VSIFHANLERFSMEFPERKIQYLIVPYSRSYDLVVLIFPFIVLANMPQTRDRWLFALALFSFFLLPLTSLSVTTPLIFVILLLLKSKKRLPPQDDLK